MSRNIEEHIRAAFEAEETGTEVPAGLRRRVIDRAMATSHTSPQRRRERAWTLGSAPRMVAFAAAVAVVMVAVGGVGLYAGSRPAPVTATRAPVQASPSPGQLAFGQLPAPGSAQPPSGGGLGAGGGTAVAPYYGAATMTWGGQLPVVPSLAPVYRFALPSAADADAFAAKLGASLVGVDDGGGNPGAPQQVRNYRGPDGFRLQIMFGGPSGPVPAFTLLGGAGAPPAAQLGDDVVKQAADAFVARLGLSPAWPYRVSVRSYALREFESPSAIAEYVVVYQRRVDLGGGGQADVVDGAGEPSVLSVDVDSTGKPVAARGVLPAPERSAAYPLRSPAEAVQPALTAKPAARADSIRPEPTVELTRAQLVYVVAVSGSNGYLEPAYFFSGTFVRHGVTFEKRVLVPGLSLNSLQP